MTLEAEIRELRAEIARKRADGVGRATNPFAKYRYDPIGYAQHVLEVKWWEKQREIALSLIRPPYKTLVKASHSVGKSHLAGGIVNWWYDTRDPGVALTTAPVARQVQDVLWKEVRRQRKGRGGFVGPKKPRLESSPWHFAYGLTADDGTSFQGQHEAAVLIVLDEAVGVDRGIWEAADSMVQGVEFAFLAICNPTDTASEFYARCQYDGYTVIEIPCLEHPNIAAELEGLEVPYPQAVRLGWFEEHLKRWSDRIDPKDGRATDIQWPPGSGVWYRPGPLAQARLLARWPDSGCGVWSDSLWSACEVQQPLPKWDVYPEIGCDVARFGDDYTEIHVRCGPCSLHHEAHNGWDTAQTAGQLKVLARQWCEWMNERRPRGMEAVKPEAVPIKVDDDGVGGGVIDQRGKFNFSPCSAANVAYDPENYPNRRSELWFAVAERAKRGQLDVSRLSRDQRAELKRQAVSPVYKLDAAGRRVVEPKDKTKEKLGRSPDGLDAMNLAFAPAGGGGARLIEGKGSR